MKKLLALVQRRLALILASGALAILLAAMPASAMEVPAGFTQVEDTVIYTAGSVQPEDAAYSAAIYWQAPTGVLQALVANGYHIYIDDEQNPCTAFQVSLTIPEGTRAAGYSHYAGNYIYILSGRNIRNEGSTLMHELGHFVDWYTNGGHEVTGSYYNGSGTDTWKAIYEAERTQIGSVTRLAASNVYSPLEAFATAFDLYVLHPEELAAAAPMTYGYIDACVATFP